MAYLEKAQAKVAPSLAPGEHPTAIARFQSKGQAGAMAVGGLVGGAIQAARTKGDRAAAAEAGVTLPPRGVFVVTNQRILVFSQSAFSATPKKLIAEIPRTSLAGAENTGKGMAMKRIRLHYPTGGASELDVVGKDGVDQLVGALSALVQGGAPPA